MRYVGRHRGPRPLLLRRPVVGGVAAAALLAGPVLYVTGSFSGAIQGGTSTKQIAEGTKTSSTLSSLDVETDPESTVIPTDDTTESPTRTKGPTTALTTVSGGYRAPRIRTTRPTTRPSTPRKTTPPKSHSSTSKPDNPPPTKSSTPTPTSASPTPTTSAPAG
jgi:hypothetical protein